MPDLERLESAVLEKLLEGEIPELRCLRAQLSGLRVKSREVNGVGFFTEFAHDPDVVRLRSPGRIRFGDVYADIAGLAHGAGFVLFIDDGIITMLEGYSTANESWPSTVGKYSLRYISPSRDLSVLRRVLGSVNE